MKKLLLSGLLCAFAAGAMAQIATNAPEPKTLDDVVNELHSMIASNDETKTNLYVDDEITIKLGGIYSQDTGEAGALFDVCKWGLIKNVGVGAAVIEGNSGGQSGTAASYGYVAYRRIIGNVAGNVFAGFGADFTRKTGGKGSTKAMGILGCEAEYRFTKNLASFVGAGYEIAGDTKRGIVAGGGFKYIFGSIK